MWGELLAAGVRIHEYQPAMTHAKVLIVDELWAVLGTTNIDNRSFEHNDEINVAMRDPQVAARLLQDFEQDLRDSEEVTFERWKRRPLWEKIVGPVCLDPGATAVSESKSRRHVDVRIATYNIHRCRGMDRTCAGRIADVIREMNADVVALQEVIGAGSVGRRSGRGDRRGARHGLGDALGAAPAQHQFGNVVLSRFPIVHHGHYDLSWRTCEERACQRADLDLGDGATLHIYNVHLGTAVLERRYQAGRLAAFVHDHRVTDRR